MIDKHDEKKKKQERQALELIAEITNIPVSHFIQGECPDIQNKTDSIGIEVTTAITRQDGITKHLTERIFGHEYIDDDNLRTAINKIDTRFNGDAYVIDNIACISSNHGLTDTMDMLDIIKQTVDKKNIKLDTYKQFEHNWLYIDFPSALFEDYEIVWICMYELTRCDFESIIIKTLDKIYKVQENSMPLCIKIDDYKQSIE